METMFDRPSRKLAEPASRRSALKAVLGIVLGGTASCFLPTSSSSSSSSSGTTSKGCQCSKGYTYNYSSQKCCATSTPYYYPGTHGITGVGCYASCPYVGDCGTQYTAC